MMLTPSAYRGLGYLAALDKGSGSMGPMTLIVTTVWLLSVIAAGTYLQPTYLDREACVSEAKKLRAHGIKAKCVVYRMNW